MGSEPKRPKRPSGAIVQGTLESLVDEARPSCARVILCCGHCGVYGQTGVWLMYHDPEGPDDSYEEQLEQYRTTLSHSLRCPHCGVQNVATDVETYLREQREGWARTMKLLREWDEREQKDRPKQ